MEHFKEANKFQCYNPKYNVLCCFFNDDYEIIGYNNTKNINSYIPVQLHAELDAMNKIAFKSLRKQKMNCLVLRYTKHKYCCNSRPCYYCAKKLSEFYQIKIRNVFFFENEELVKITINELIDENTASNLSSGFRYRMNLMNRNKKDLKYLLKRL
ncbi:MAG: hypothetical protein MJ224_07855 [archaeon]|nr:hypothetical protein [archaeon]